jgi:hypothetical protein
MFTAFGDQISEQLERTTDESISFEKSRARTETASERNPMRRISEQLWKTIIRSGERRSLREVSGVKAVRMHGLVDARNARRTTSERNDGLRSVSMNVIHCGRILE